MIFKKSFGWAWTDLFGKNPLCSTLVPHYIDPYIMSANGLSDSVTKTIEAKEAKIKLACLEIIDIIQDWRAQMVGGIESALLMWEACCAPSLLSGTQWSL